MSGKTKILIVEDDRDMVHAVRTVLEREGYDVVEAYNAEQGRDKAEKERPDLILLDVMMPSSTEGFHFVWKLRQAEDDYLRRVPIIILSAIHDKTDLRFYPDSGDGTYKAGEFLPVQDFVDKPVDLPLLLERVQRILELERKS